MNRIHALCAAGALFAATLPAWADSTSSASSAVSNSIGSSSTSIEKSSNSSSKKNDVAAGHYQVVQMVAMAERPGQLRLTMQGDDGTADTRFYLYLPETTVQEAGLTTGQTVTALTRPYGTAFAKADATQPFFLVMQDAWLRELPSRPVVL